MDLYGDTIGLCGGNGFIGFAFSEMGKVLQNLISGRFKYGMN